MHDLAIIGGNVYLNGKFRRADLYIKNGQFTKIEIDPKQHLAAIETFNADGYLVCPGIIDPHVHMALDLGKTQSCDDFFSGSSAAATGGVTTLIDFLEPIAHEDALHSPLEARKKEAKESLIDYTFHVTLAEFHGNIPELVKTTKSLGMNSVKVFTTYAESGRMIQKHHIEALLSEDIVTMVHAENNDLVDPNWKDIATYEQSRPLESELSALNQLISSRDKTTGDGTLYIVHVSSGSGVERLKNHSNVVIESCPHYYYLNASAFATEQGARYLLAPPLRAAEEQSKLIMHIDDIHTIGTDHCPFMLSEKLISSNASEIPKGIGSIQHSFLLMYNKFGEKVIDKMTRKPAEVFGLAHKGQIKIGYDGDLFLLDPNGKTVISPNVMGSRCDYSVYEGLTLDGEIIGTIVRGSFVYKNGNIQPHQGTFIKTASSGEGSKT